MTLDRRFPISALYIKHEHAQRAAVTTEVYSQGFLFASLMFIFIFQADSQLCGLGWPRSRDSPGLNLLSAGTTDIHCHVQPGSALNLGYVVKQKRLKEFLNLRSSHSVG